MNGDRVRAGFWTSKWARVEPNLPLSDQPVGLVSYALSILIGIGLYFCWPAEPGSEFKAGLAMITALIILIVYIRLKFLPTLVKLVLVCMLAFQWAALMTMRQQTPTMPEWYQSYALEGWVVSRDMSGDTSRWIVSVSDMTPMPDAGLPETVRIRLTKGDGGLGPGDNIEVRAVLTRPKGAAFPGSYDSRKWAWFQKIGGTGNATIEPKTLQRDSRSWSLAARQSIIKFRYNLSDRILAKAPPDTAGLQSALLTGDRSQIPKDQQQALRDTGLAHILAISGLHMGLVSGGIYIVALYGLIMIQSLSRRYDMRIFAAVLGWISATAYLVLSGGSVSTERAYVMSSVVFLSIILGRKAISLRSVALAAVIIVALEPWAVMSVGFQMSFAAVTALVVVYEAWRQRNRNRAPAQKTVTGRTVGVFAGLSATSLIAGVATGGFAAITFQRVARFGLAANILAMPIFSFAVMPLGVLALALMPLGLEEPALWLMGKSLSLVLWIAFWVQSWPGALMLVKASPAGATLIFGVTFLAICLGTTRVRILGLAGLGVFYVLWAITPPPTLWITTDGNWATYPDKDGNIFSYKPNADKFEMSLLAEHAAIKEYSVSGFADSSRMNCDDVGCAYIDDQKPGLNILMRAEGLNEACSSDQMIIMIARKPGPIAQRHCEAMLIDPNQIEERGPLFIYSGDNKWRVRWTYPPENKRRIWQ